MAGLALPMGSDVTIKWQGDTYRLAPLTLRDFGTIEHELLKRKREQKLGITLALHGKIPDELFVQQLDKTREESEKLSVSDLDVQGWMDADREGVAFTLWLSLEKNYAGKFKLEEMTDVLVAQVSEEELMKLIAARDQVNGLDDAGKDTGLEEGPAQAKPVE